MTGSGTQTDPYLVADVYDFCAISDSETYSGNYFKLTADIDFNDHETYKNGISAKIIDRTSAFLDGDGHKISNLTFYNYDAKIKFSTISNAVFVNAMYQTGYKSGIYNAQIYASAFYSCNFGCHVSNAELDAVFHIGTNNKFYDCTFNLKGTASETRFGCTFNRCHINFEDFTCNDSNGVFRGDSNGYLYFYNTYITGKITAPNTNYIFGSSGIRLNNSFIAAEIDSASNTKVFYTSGMVNSVSFIDIDLAPTINVGNTYSNFYYLTTAQCKDNAYLQSIGFPAFPAESS